MHRRGRKDPALTIARITGDPQGDIMVERSALVNREVVLFLFQLVRAPPTQERRIHDVFQFGHN